MFLLDTMIVSELRRPSPNASVMRWLASVPQRDQRLSVITLMEIERGVERKRTKDAVYADRLALWQQNLIAAYASNILPLTLSVARRWGFLEARLKRSSVDLAISATAIEHNLQVVTRNVRHFESTGAAIFNPFGPA